MGEKEILEKIIEDFDLEKFETFFRRKNDKLRFYRETLNNYGNQDFTDGVKLSEGELDDGEFIICAFKVQKNLSERSGKKKQYEIGKKILKDYEKDAGIFIFYDKEKNFRFSLIYPIYTGRKREWSNFKRFTYFVSKQETNKTFKTQIGEGDFSSIEKIKEAFSVEKVTKEFYQEIAYWYFWALKHAKFPEDAEIEKNGRNIALIRLITRLIFIWFMRQKGIIKRELFDLDFLKEILKDVSLKENTYYLAILQNLFFATLNTPVEDRKFRREERHKGYLNKDYMNHSYYRHHSLFKDPDRMIELFNNIPFLNGGLFECLDKRKDDESNDTGKEIRIDGFSDSPKKQPHLPNFLFFSEEKEVDLNDDFGTKGKKYKVRGIINILNSYNFTIDENTPVDEEIALDPELLGRVFENLLASYNPETSTTARKATGSYYTPREIVDFMVKESLKEYFKTKIENIDQEKLEKLFQYDDTENPFDEKTTEKLIDAINNLKLLDPAVGSGAFPMGALHQLVNVLHKLDPHNEKWKDQQIKAIDYITDPKIKKELVERIEENFSLNEFDYGRKLYLIQNCLYGVDIQPIAIQIAKLRCFISLLVDENVDKNKKNFGIEPLPNLETKFVVADSLKRLKVETVIRPPDIVQTEMNLIEIRNRYFISSEITEKNKLKKKDAELRKKLAEDFVKLGNLSKTDSEKIASWNPYNADKPADLFDPELMFGIREGFDIVIGNPPYIQLQKDGGKLAEEYQEYNYDTFARTGDIYTLFYERGIDLLQDNGLLCYITSNKWMRSGYGEKLRGYFTQYNPILLIDLGPGVFEHATVDTNILLLQKKEGKRYDYKLKGLTLQKTDKQSIEQQIKVNSVTIKKLTKDVWFIGSSAEQRLKDKIEKIGKPLKLWDVNIFYGIKTGLNEAFIITTEKRNEILANCKDKEERKRTEAIIKPILRGRDIKRYYYEWAGLWVIGTFPALNLNIEEYPSLKKYFLDNFDIRQLEQSGKKYPNLGFDARKKTGNKWFETQDQIAYYPEFEKEKVVWTPVNSEYSFTILPKGLYFNNSVFMITECKPKYVCAIFNSKLLRKYLEFLFSSEKDYTYASK
ncbi:MAG: N-6 DNA methylase, partial [candidate division WOR-3 bacterium]